MLLSAAPIPGIQTALRNRGPPRDQQQRSKRRDDGRHRDRGETADAVKCRADRRAERKRREHRRTNPGDDLSGILSANQRQSPADCAGDDEALGCAQRRTTEQKNRHRGEGGLKETQRQKIEQSCHKGGYQAARYAAFDALAVRIVPGPNPRQQRRHKLAAGDEADRKSAEPQPVADMQGKNRKRETDDQKGNKNHGHNRH
jgi:hypothetical protein